MNMQKTFEKSENSAVFLAVLLFAIVHFGLLYLFEVVKF